VEEDEEEEEVVQRKGSLALWLPASLQGKQGSKLTQQKSYFSSFLLSFALEYWW
jgi:hypothetical protein